MYLAKNKKKFVSAAEFALGTLRHREKAQL